MLFNVVLVIVLLQMVVDLILLPFFIIYSIKSMSGEEMPKIDIPLPAINKKKKAKVSKEEQRVLDIMANIDAYNGSSLGQKPIKEK